MALPFYDRVTPRCGLCKARKPVAHYAKWHEGRFWVAHPVCVACEPSAKPENPARDEALKERAYLAEQAPRMPKLVPMATCPGCSMLLKLPLFRKWWGAKRMKRTLCIKCEPERKLEDMTPAERETMLALGRARVTPERIANLSAAEADATRRRRSTGAKRRHSAARTQAWAPMLHIFRTELDWCRKGKLAKYLSPERLVFFEAYEAALTDALSRAKTKRAASTSTTQVPHPKEFMFPETRASLARLYAAGAASRGRRLSRDPVFLDWINEETTNVE